TFSGEATYYNLGLTACGQTYTDSDMVAAISFPLFNRDSPANPNLAPSCGKKIKVMRGGKSVVVQIRDKCEACKEYDVDLSPAAFNQLGVEQEGRFPITWQYL
ncbi:RlpA-like double-psi beta-barrel-protein domain-containing protein-containing protein, partial [Protomyces lactucae-debilis]